MPEPHSSPVTAMDSHARKYDVVTFGDLCVDVVLSGRDVTPQFGQVEKLVDDYTVEMGGSCSIFACQAARLGLRVGILGRVGPDDFGRLISFDAGFLAGWLRGMPLEQCLRMGCICGRAVASKVGGVEGQPTWEIVTQSLQQSNL